MNGLEVSERLKALNMLISGSDIVQTAPDEYRRIKTPLLSNAFGKASSLVDQGNIILVTSTLPGEGKTYSAVNLALSIANEQDNTVLLIDCDLEEKGASRMFGVEKQPGLMDLLENEFLDISDVMIKTDLPSFTIVSAGKQIDDATELLSSKRMKSVMQEIRTRYENRIIILDSPAVLSTPQTKVLSNLVGQIVYIVEEGKTPKYLVKEAIEQLPEEKAIGLVLNKREAFGGYR